MYLSFAPVQMTGGPARAHNRVFYEVVQRRTRAVSRPHWGHCKIQSPWGIPNKDPISHKKTHWSLGSLQESARKGRGRRSCCISSGMGSLAQHVQVPSKKVLHPLWLCHGAATLGSLSSEWSPVYAIFFWVNVSWIGLSISFLTCVSQEGVHERKDRMAHLLPSKPFLRGPSQISPCASFC